MSSIRVTGLGTTTLEDDLKVYFSKPEHGGGPIDKIYLPLMNNDAVIVFQESHVAAQVMSLEEHKVGGRDVDVYILPPTVFSTVQARVDPAVSLLIDSVTSCKDKLQYIIDLNVTFDSSGCCVLEGNMFQIEMGWEVIGRFLQQQERIHSRASNNSLTSLTQTKQRSHTEKSGSSKCLPVASGIQEIDAPYWSKTGHLSDNEEEDSPAFLREKERDKHKKASVRITDRIDRDRRNLPMEISHDTRMKSTSNARPITSPGAEWTKELSSYPEDQVDRLFSETTDKLDSLSQRQIDRIFTESGKSPKAAKSHYETEYSAMTTKPSTSHFEDNNRIDETRQLIGQERPSDFLSLHSLNGRESVHAFSPHVEGSSDEDSFGRGTRRFDDANNTFEDFSSMRHASKSKGGTSKSLKSSKSSIGPGNSSKQRDIDSAKPSTSSATVTRDDSTSVVEKLLSTQYSSLEPQLDALRHSQMAALQSDHSQTNSFTFYAGSLKVTVRRGNITEMETVAIVNAANGSLAHGAGVAGAIARAASPSMEKECDAYIKKHGLMSTGEIMHTRAGGQLSSKVTHILHAVGPIWLDNLPDRCMYELMLTYVNLFKYANKLWIPSIALPCISSGVFGSPLDVSIKCFLDGVLIFHSELGDHLSHLKEIILVNMDEDGVATSIAILHSLLDGGQDLATAEAIDRFSRLQEKRRATTNKLKLIAGRSLIKDDISTDTGRKTDLVHNESSRARRRSSSMSRLKPKAEPNGSDKRVKEDNSSRSRSSSIKVNGTSSTLEKKSPRPHSSSRPSSQATYTKQSDETKSPRQPPALKPALVTTSPPSAGAKPKTKPVHSVTSKNTPMKAGSGTATMDAFTMERDFSQMRMNQTTNGAFKHYSREHYEDDFHSLPINLDSQREEKSAFCKICHGKMKKAKTLNKCNHTFCTECIEKQFRKFGPKCPQCGTMYSSSVLSKTTTEEADFSPRSLLTSTVVHSSEPRGTMSHMTRRNMTVPGYEYCEGAIEIQYDIPSGKILRSKDRGSSHSAYSGVQCKAYLPNSAEAREVLRLLKRAFEENLVFKVSSRGTIEWCISHKTSLQGSSGYPDSSYLRRVKDELHRRGVS